MGNKIKNGYTRIVPAPLFSLGVSQSIWMGDDHLLVVNKTVANERYQRFFLKDIQAFQITSTSRRTIFTVLWVIFLIGSASMLLGEGGWRVTGWVGCIVFMLSLLLNLSFGESVRCTIKTAIGESHLPTLRRNRASLRFLDDLRNLVAPLQTLPAEGLTLPQPSAVNGLVSPASDPSPEASTTLGDSAYDRGTQMAFVATLSLTALGVLAFAKFSGIHFGLWLARCLLFLTLIVSTFVSLAKYSLKVHGPLVRKAIWWVFGILMVYIVGLYGVYMYMSVRMPHVQYDAKAFYEGLSWLNPNESKVGLVCTITEGVLATVSGLILTLILGVHRGWFDRKKVEAVEIKL